ncbi:MAG: ATP-binding protein [Nitrospinota bacterium]|nr:ATP-binding protein [Nitrospinota bacterium]MDH5678579.1 ATP-binding protein [Nitrospinota bacterium]MDH5757437.1 ATP-binding protein [Nitrospinota bacterium]
MRDISIKIKLYGVLALFLISFAAIWSMTFSTSRQVGAQLDPSKVEIMRQADALRQAMGNIERDFNAAVQEQDMDLLSECDTTSEVFRAALTKLTALDSANRAEYIRVRDSFDVYFRSAKAVAIILIRGDVYNREINTHAGYVQQTLPGLKQSVEVIANRNYGAFTELLERSVTLTNMLVKENSIVVFTLLAVSAIFLPFIIRSITVPLSRLASTTRHIAVGNLNIQAEVMANDEVGELAVAFNEMIAALKEKGEALARTTEELKLVNAELREADRLKSDFLASVSHELRTPLNSIINFSEMILEDWSQVGVDEKWTGEARDMLNRTVVNSRRLLIMINDLLDLAKIEAGHMELFLEKTDIKEVVADAVATVSSLARSKNLEIGYKVLDQPPEFLVDEHKVLQILINLLSNAIKFTDEGSVSVEILRAPEGGAAVVRIIDTGIGISQEDLAIIFNRFRQAEGADTRKYSGTGLGLNLAQHLAELHGGWIKAESEKGKGATFTLFLPFDPTRPIKIGQWMGQP